ncbi:MAG TPA: potassium channel family protein, partial [Reyranella sp.]|nr:potassium channel family protein [Reyranella sp.]
LLTVPHDQHWMRPISNGAMALFHGVVLIALLRYVLDYRVISTDKVFGAVAAYVLIAITFACLFGLLQYIETNAFYIAQVNDPDGKLTWSDLMYFSFTVLTSTGFGEITPVTPMARSLIVIEQVLGVMYVAFLVARLANLYGLSHRR